MSYFPSQVAEVLAVGEQTGISVDTLTTIVTVPANGIRCITKVVCTGEENARWDIYVDSVRKATKRTTDRNAEFDFDTPFELAGSTVFDVKATHHGPDASADFQATVFGFPA